MITEIKNKITQIIQIQDEQKRKVLLIGIGALILLLVDVFFIFLPLVNRVFYLRTQIISAKKNISYLNQQISMLDSTKKRFEGLKAEQIQFGKSFPKEEEIPGLLGNLSSIAGKLGMDIIAVKPVRVESGQEIAKGSGLFHEIPIEISAKGGYHQIGQFINKLETLDKFIEVDDVEITADKTTPRRHYLRLLLSTYILRV